MKRAKGFSLVEIFVTVGIIGFLLFIGIVNYNNYRIQQLARETSQHLVTDLQFAAQNTVTEGIINGGGIQFSANNDGWQVVDARRILKSTAIPLTVSILVSVSLSNANPAQGTSSVIVFPTGSWLGFAQNGRPLTQNGESVMVVVTTEGGGSWYAIMIDGITGSVSGPTNNRSDLSSYSDAQILAQINNLADITKPAASVEAMSSLSSSPSSPVIEKIKTKWGF